MSTAASTSAGNTGALGRSGGIVFVLVMLVIAIGIFSIYWAYKTHEEMKQHTGDWESRAASGPAPAPATP